jgi:CO/xanthine dehydrogenase Mo-binding subunit
VRTTNKSPFALRQQLATVTGEPLDNIVVDSRFIGGDFGGKGLSIDEYACYYLAKATDRPVKSIMTFADEMMAGTPRHNTVCTLRTGVTREGKIIAHAGRAHYNGGAYQAPKPMVWSLDTWSALQAYSIPNCRHFVAGSERKSFDEVGPMIARGGPVEERGAYDSVHNVPHPDGPEDDYNFYACMIEVAVDPETGEVRILDAVAAVDVGQIINPVSHQGQLEGAFVYGVGNAVMEELFEENGRMITPNLSEYKLPTQMDVPPLRTLLVKTDVGPGPFDAKAAGEITNSGVAAAVANAVYDAVGVRIMTLPVTAERVFNALHAG